MLVRCSKHVQNRWDPWSCDEAFRKDGCANDNLVRLPFRQQLVQIPAALLSDRVFRCMRSVAHQRRGCSTFRSQNTYGTGTEDTYKHVVHILPIPRASYEDKRNYSAHWIVND